jgi:CheY-like chemotaxis protein
MNEMGRILIVDDDDDFVSFYKAQLALQGYSVESARDESLAKRMLEEAPWDVVLLDQKLRGAEGPDDGLDLIADTLSRAPRAKTILMSGYASPQAIERAFALGVYDYLEKGANFRVFLEVKLRNAVGAARAEQLVGLSSAETEALIRDTWQAARTETDANRKGKLLEDLLVYLLRTIQGFRQASPRRRNDIEEIDIVVQNESNDPLWAKEQQYILVECKNWSKPVGAPELHDLIHKMERRFDRCRLSFFVALKGFAGTFKQALLAERKGHYLVVLIDGSDLNELVTSSDRNQTLKDLHNRAIVELNGDADAS